MRSVLRQLLLPDHEELLKTLWIYLEEDHSLQHAAQRLHVHRNTVLYRLHQVARLTGRSLRRTSDVTALWIALQAWAWSRADGPWPSSTS
ncbi:MAG: helix-turn-helix domain-containing protein [Actinomycetia bacterium]|nr:helix-turn-helix domain-containing protein [Actinomycetes bacterium]